MHFSLSALFVAALGLTSTALAAAIPETEHTVSEYHWHGCAAGVFCTSDSDCRSEDACLTTADNIPTNIHCGQANYPHSCWAEYTT
ncbi:hypothetical protein P170DRAFT_481264 [Aspergillus steynii IBT 23096]|uniref:Uncharacterized protein n=1 Tax=Aspergillus steynii IBT 23096 TaxID=1392250 RepID=A0A2I2FRS9_9EURO|nr:uncharacterized protein P170DRAFT_481264 [Aspergillus steynii IBT 23096]PLB43317.1 hypothetical protein P170DRAFT_481264 [Aspergillus steynii IBT 23096]